MNAANAPLYVRAHDLAVTLARSSNAGTPTGVAALAAAFDLVTAVSLALTFPADRAAALRAADHAVVRVRVLLRVAVDTGTLSTGAMRTLASELDQIGKMLGGWQRRQRRAHRGGELHDAPLA